MKYLKLTATDNQGDKIVADFYTNFLSSKLARKFVEGHVKIELGDIV